MLNQLLFGIMPIKGVAVIDEAPSREELLQSEVNTPAGSADAAPSHDDSGASPAEMSAPPERAGEPAEPVVEGQTAEPQETAQSLDSDEASASKQPDSAAGSADQGEAEGHTTEADADEQGVGEEDEFVGHAEPLELIEEAVAAEDIEMRWYILKVASNRENSIADALRRRIKVEGMEDYFGEIIVPTEDVAEYKNGKKRIVKRKLYPGYICAKMHINDNTWFLVRDTPGIGDFTGAAGRPTPMLDHEVERILPKKKGEDEGDDKVKIGIPFKVADRVRIKEGTFENFEGDVEGIDEANGRVTVVINIFDRPTPVEIDHWQLEAV